VAPTVLVLEQNLDLNDITDLLKIELRKAAPRSMRVFA